MTRDLRVIFVGERKKWKIKFKKRNLAHHWIFMSAILTHQEPWHPQKDYPCEVWDVAWRIELKMCVWEMRKLNSLGDEGGEVRINNVTELFMSNNTCSFNLNFHMVYFSHLSAPSFQINNIFYDSHLYSQSHYKMCDHVLSKVLFLSRI